MTIRPLGDRRLLVGVIGCGQIATPHVQTLMHDCGEVELHLCDSNAAAAESLAARTGAAPTFHADAEAMLAGVGLDAVFVLTPPTSHFALARAALTNGAHTLVEKPFTMSLAEAEGLYALADEHERLLCVDHSNLYMPSVVEGLDLLASGAVGRPLHFHCFYGHAEKGGSIPYANPDHWAYRMPGGVLLNLISHPASLMVAMIGAPQEVIARRATRNVMPHDIPDSLSVMVDSGDAYGTLAISMAHGNHYRHATLWCEGGTLFFDLTRQTFVASRHRGPIGLVPKMLGGVQMGMAQALGTAEIGAKVATKRMKREPGVRALGRAFVASLREGTPPPVSRENVYGVARVQEESLATAVGGAR